METQKTKIKKPRKPWVFKDPEFKQRITKFMIPFLIQELILTFTALIGTLMIQGQPGVTPDIISGMTNAYQIFFIFNMSTLAITFIGNLFISQHYGRGHLDKIEEDMYLLLKISLIISIIFTVLCATIPELILSVFTPGNDAIIQPGAQYLRIFSASFIPTGITMINYCVMRNVKMEKYVVINSAYCLVLNILLNAIFVYGTPQLGIYGLALSLVISRFVECVSAILMENVRGYIHFHFKAFFKLNKPLIKEFSRYIVLIFLAKFLWVVGSVGISIVVGRTGNTDLIFANSLMTQMKSIVITISSAAASAVCIIVGRELGANRLTKAKEHGQDARRFALFIGIIQIIAFAITLPVMYLANIDKFTDASLIFLFIIYGIYATQLIPQAFNAILCNGLFNAGGDIKIVTIFDSVTGWVLLIPAILIVELVDPAMLTSGFFALIPFIIVIIDELVKFPFYLTHYAKGKWIKNITGKGGFVFN